MAGSLRIHDLEYLYASNANASNFVSVKLSSRSNYRLWKTQMLCLMKSHKMAGIVDEDDASVNLRASSMAIMHQYDSLLKGWIFGSVSENVLGDVVDLASAKDVWGQLKSFYDVTVSHQQDSIATKPEAKTKTKDTDAETNDKTDILSIKIGTEAETEPEIEEFCMELHKVTMKGNWAKVEKILKKHEHEHAATKAICKDGSTVLHIAVGVGHNDFVKRFISFIKDDQELIKERHLDGRTALHIAAIVGNTDAAKLMVKRNQNLLFIKDHKGKQPLHKAYETMHLGTIGYLLKATVVADKNEKTKSAVPQMQQPDDKIGVDLLVNAIFAQEYNLASESLLKFPKFATKSDNVLMAIAKSFPSGDYERTYKPPSWKDLWKGIRNMAKNLIKFLRTFLSDAWEKMRSFNDLIANVIFTVLLIVPVMLLEVFILVCGLILLPSLSLSYVLTWMSRIIDKSGYDIIQLAIIHRSERIYNLIYDIGERKNLYRTIVDSSKNNILHLAGRLAPSGKLNKRRGASLQLQRELQWLEEVKKVVFPTYITQDNIFLETPAMVFTREHENLVKDGEQWLKTTAESCSISAGLIITILFAAAITVPGGSNKDTGIPLFTQDIAFAIFAVSDAISLFASSTALLVFLSILTSRFAEYDFLPSLPR